MSPSGFGVYRNCIGFMCRVSGGVLCRGFELEALGFGLAGFGSRVWGLVSWVSGFGKWGFFLICPPNARVPMTEKHQKRTLLVPKGPST